MMSAEKNLDREGKIMRDEKTLGREEIEKILPHRKPMLLLDEVTMKEETAFGSYTVRGDEFFVQGHFPGRPIVPGVILCEILAQSACVLLQDSVEEGKLPLYTGIDRARFRAPVLPGDTITTSCRFTRVKKPFYFVKGEVRVGEKLCASAEFSFAVSEV